MIESRRNMVYKDDITKGYKLLAFNTKSLKLTCCYLFGELLNSSSTDVICWLASGFRENLRPIYLVGIERVFLLKLVVWVAHNKTNSEEMAFFSHQFLRGVLFFAVGGVSSVAILKIWENRESLLREIRRRFDSNETRQPEENDERFDWEGKSSVSYENILLKSDRILEYKSPIFRVPLLSAIDYDGTMMFPPQKLSQLIELIFSCAEAIFIIIFLFLFFSWSTWLKKIVFLKICIFEAIM